MTVPLDTPLVPEQRRHIFVDNSNIFVSAQHKDPTRQDFAIRVKSNTLGRLLRNGDKEGTRVVAGSKPPADESIWQYWESVGFKVKVCSRDVDTGREDLVDDFLSSQAQGCVMNRQGERPGENTLVICSGDGNGNKGFTSFYDVARNTARLGWRVEVWSWSWSLSQRFRALEAEFQGRVRIVLLDPYWDRITMR